jgi:hypothetical protein
MPKGGVKSGIKATSKSIEKELLDKIKKFLNEPETYMPVCTNDCSHCPFKNYVKKIEKLKENGINSIGGKISISFGGEIIKAFADFTEVVEDKKELSHIGITSIDKESYYYIYGKHAKIETLIGLLNKNKPHVHMLAFSTEVKHGYVFYITDKLLCAGINGKIPEQFIEYINHTLNYSFKREGNILSIGDPIGPYINVSVGGIEINIYKSKASDKSSFVNDLYDYIGTRKNEKSNVAKTSFYVKIGDKLSPITIEKEIYKSYLNGQISDKNLLNKVVNAYTNQIKSEKDLILNWVSYKNDIDGFLNALNTKPHEIIAIKNFIKKYGSSIVFEGLSGVKFIETYWEVGKEAFTEPFGKEPNVPANKADAFLYNLWKEKFKKERLLKIPELSNVRDDLKFLDNVIRIYHSQGVQDVKNYLHSYKNPTFKMKAISYALFTILGSIQDVEWKMTKEEKEMGTKMKPKIEEILNSEGENYISKIEEFKKLYNL